MKRWIYALKGLWKHRNHMGQYMSSKDNKHTVRNVTAITADSLANAGIKHLILDFDGVMAPHGNDKPDNDVVNWLHTLAGKVGLYILTNKPTGVRQEYFAKEFPEVIFLNPGIKKPYPDGINLVCEQYSVDNSEIAIADDRLATGMLAAKNANVTGIYVHPARANVKNKPVVEVFFALLRWVERYVIKKAGIPKKQVPYTTALFDSVPIFFAYFPVGVVFGLLFESSGYPWWLAPIISALVYGGSVQFLVLSSLDQGVASIQILISSFLVSARNAFLSSDVRSF